MPPKQNFSWIKNGKRVYYNKNKKGKWVAKKATRKAVKRVQEKTELKDRVVKPLHHDLSTFTGSPTLGPSDTYIMVPESFMNSITQGDLNGQVHGNEYCPKYLNMKVKLNFELLNPMGSTTGVAPFTEPQSYTIMVTQGWVKISLKSAGELSQVHANVSSGRNQPAFAAGANPHTLALTVVKRAMYQANFNRDFLSYEKRSYEDVKVIRRFRVFGDKRRNFVTPEQSTTLPLVSVAPDKNLSFNWKMMNKKQELAPIVDNTTAMGNADTWIPFVAVSLDHDIGMATNSALRIEQANHFTYSDL